MKKILIVLLLISNFINAQLYPVEVYRVDGLSISDELRADPEIKQMIKPFEKIGFIDGWDKMIAYGGMFYLKESQTFNNEDVVYLKYGETNDAPKDSGDYLSVHIARVKSLSGETTTLITMFLYIGHSKVSSIVLIYSGDMLLERLKT